MRKLVVSACLCTAASGVAALSLGPSSGAVVLGSPVDLKFEVQPDPGKDLASSCLSARLVLGSNVISDSRVQVTPIDGGAVPMVRVQTRMPTDEPVLTVTLAAGCEGRFTRTYTFLVDPPAAAPLQRPPVIADLSAADAPRGAVEAAAGAAPSGARGRDLAGARPAALGAPAIRGSVRPQPRRNAKAPAQAERARARALVPKPAPEPAPRLLVEPLDLWLDAPLALRLTRDEPLPLSAPDEARRTESAALWKMLNATPEDMQRAMAQLDKLQADVKAQSQQMQAERAKLAELQQRLELVEQERFSATWIYALGGLLALAVGALAWVQRRTRREQQLAWQHSVACSESLLGNAPLAEGEAVWQPAQDAPDTWHPSSLPPDEGESEHLQIDAPDTVSADPVHVTSDLLPLEPAVPRLARAQQILPQDALFDIQQQAEFFISIGEHDQAIEVLRAQIDEHGDTTPWAYLESLRLFSMLGRIDAFNRMREQFQARFNACVPDFAQFQHGGRTLEDYPEALAQIEALWSSPEVLGVLDGFLFRDEQSPQGERFDLAAFGDLLLLLAIVQVTPAHLRGAPPPRERTTPRAASKAAAPGRVSLDAIAGDLPLMSSGYDRLSAQPESRVSLDVDLSLRRVPDIVLDHEPVASLGSAGVGGTVPGFDDRFDFTFELENLDKAKTRL